MNNVMIDLETLGKKPSAQIAAIGAVFFDPENYGLGEKFYTRVDFENHMEKGAVADGDTIKWWLLQPSEARAELVGDDAASIHDALGDFSDWLTDNADDLDSLKVWAKSPSFDCVILRTAFGLSFDDVPWKYWNERDVRTIEALGLAKGVGTQMFKGIKHHALDDAINQARMVTYVWANLTRLDGLELPHSLDECRFESLEPNYIAGWNECLQAMVDIRGGKFRSPTADLVFSEVADFFAGLGQPGEPSSPATMQKALINRLAEVMDARAPK
ncbi:3'-5' exonuclease [Brenneria populi]|uniref:3'-5' exonuclease n=1 Tax=Brenneria populi TaxID=1505588 RepID=A0ABU6JS38_9GAMM|nr:3'-5' exonuclease [Brenneria populi Li et al. 2015]